MYIVGGMVYSNLMDANTDTQTLLDDEVREHLEHRLSTHIYWMGKRTNVRFERRALAQLRRTPNGSPLEGELAEAAELYGTHDERI